MKCPVCELEQVTQYKIDGVEWFHCYCGTVFHGKGIDKSVFDKDYLDKFLDQRFIDERMKYSLKTYLPLVEEMINGRKFLDVGFSKPTLINDMKERGWISTGIDLVPNEFITGDFEDYDFGDLQFDFIHLGHVLESFNSPIQALWKCYDLLSKDGIMLITHPAPELIHHVGIQKFGHWDALHNQTFISEREIKRITLGLGFDIILMRVNHSQRFVSWNDRHILLQKRY